MEIEKIRLSDSIEVPYLCDMYVLERIQDKYGTIEEFEKELIGLHVSGEGDEKKIELKEPSVKAILYALPLMISEGIKAENTFNKTEYVEMSDSEIILSIKRNYRHIATDLHDELKRCFNVKKKTEEPSKTKEKMKKKIKRWISNIFK